MLSKKEFDSSLKIATKSAFGESLTKIDYSTKLDEAGLDSLQMGNFVFAFEEATSIHISDADIEDLWQATTFGEITETLRNISMKGNQNE